MAIALARRNYVFQKRFVKFDGKNLMYFGNEKVRRSIRAHNTFWRWRSHDPLTISPVSQDAYPKGVIPLAAIQMARPAKDNKFEVVTSQRIYVFRTDEGDDGDGDDEDDDDNEDVEDDNEGNGPLQCCDAAGSSRCSNTSKTSWRSVGAALVRDATARSMASWS